MKKHQLHEKLEFTNMRELIEFAGETYADKYAYSFRRTPKSEITKIKFSSLRDDVRSLACELSDMGCAGKHCVIIGKLSYDWVLTYFAVLSIGGVLVPLDPEWQKEDLADTVSKANASFLFCDEDIKEKGEYIAEQISLEAEPVYLAAKETERNLRAAMRAGKPKFEANSDPYYHADIDPDALALLVFTSGTTGKGKGVMLSQTNICQDMTQGMYNFSIYSKKSSYSRTLCVLPPHHTFCSTIIFVGHFALGCEFYLTSGIKYLLRELQEQKPTHLVLVPLFVETLYRRIWGTAEKSGAAPKLKKGMKISGVLRKVGIDLRKKLFAQVTDTFGGHLEMVICGGAALNQDIIDFFDAVGITILNGYGISECAPLISCNRNEWQKDGSVGTPILTEKVKIDDPNEDGEGEICVKGPNVMLGYYKEPEATAAVFDSDGYFHTGDLGRVDSDGWLYITGRKKNLIIFSNGKNVYPEEIECELSRIRGVAEVVVYAGESRNNPEKEIIVAEIYPNYEQLEADGICSEDDIESYFNEHVRDANTRMAPYKKVGLVKIRKEEFVKNTSKKITRFNIDKTID